MELNRFTNKLGEIMINVCVYPKCWEPISEKSRCWCEKHDDDFQDFCNGLLKPINSGPISDGLSKAAQAILGDTPAFDFS